MINTMINADEIRSNMIKNERHAIESKLDHIYLLMRKRSDQGEFDCAIFVPDDYTDEIVDILNEYGYYTSITRYDHLNKLNKLEISWEYENPFKKSLSKTLKRISDIFFE